MRADGVRVLPLVGDYRLGPAVEYKAAVGYNVEAGVLTVTGVIEQAQPQLYAMKVYAPGTWGTVEFLNPRADEVSKLTLAKPGLILPGGGVGTAG